MRSQFWAVAVALVVCSAVYGGLLAVIEATPSARYEVVEQVQPNGTTAWFVLDRRDRVLTGMWPSKAEAEAWVEAK